MAESTSAPQEPTLIEQFEQEHPEAMAEARAEQDRTRPPRVRADTEVYTCNTCGGVFLRGLTVRFRCAVAHPPGQCCHYGEAVAKDGEWKAVGP